MTGFEACYRNFLFHSFNVSGRAFSLSELAPRASRWAGRWRREVGGPLERARDASPRRFWEYVAARDSCRVRARAAFFSFFVETRCFCNVVKHGFSSSPHRLLCQVGKQLLPKAGTPMVSSSNGRAVRSFGVLLLLKFLIKCLQQNLTVAVLVR